jgi:hypothetical protein
VVEEVVADAIEVKGSTLQAAPSETQGAAPGSGKTVEWPASSIRTFVQNVI